MNKIRKPIPINQRDISISKITPYDTNMGDPNSALTPNPVFADPNSDSKTWRANQVAVDSKDKDHLSIGLYDIDEAFKYYMDNIIKPVIHQNGAFISIPVQYSQPELWKSVQKDGFYRDKEGKLMCPLILYKRSGFEKLKNLSNKLDANHPLNYTVTKVGYHKSNAYSNFDVLNNRRPIDTYSVTVVPDYVLVEYDCIVWTYFLEQMNKIVESINFASDSYWGDPSRFKFRAVISSFKDTTSAEQDGTRIVKTSFTVKIYGYIVPDNINNNLVSTKKVFSKGKLTFALETVDSNGELQILNNARNRVNPIYIDSNSLPGGLTMNYDYVNAIAAYLNTNVTLMGTYVNSTTATFDKGWKAAPSGLTATSINNFVFFVNGNLIEQNAITSFTDNTTSSTLIVDTSLLGYSLSSTDEIVAIGKFEN